MSESNADLAMNKQATLEIEFMHQTLSQHVPAGSEADTKLQEIYQTISQAYYRRSGTEAEAAEELPRELEKLKKTCVLLWTVLDLRTDTVGRRRLVASRKSTALQFLCFRCATA